MITIYFRHVQIPVQTMGRGWLEKTEEKDPWGTSGTGIYQLSIYPEAFLFIVSLGLNRILFPPEML
jgi:hypothetical protein